MREYHIYMQRTKRTYHGKKMGKRVQKTIQICLCCSAMAADKDILEQVGDNLGWDVPEGVE